MRSDNYHIHHIQHNHNHCKYTHTNMLTLATCRLYPETHLLLIVLEVVIIILFTIIILLLKISTAYSVVLQKVHWNYSHVLDYI